MKLPKLFKLVKNKFIIFSTIFIITTVSLPVIFLLVQMKNSFEDRSMLLMESIFDMLSFRVEHEMNDGNKKVMQKVVDDFSSDKNVDKLRIISKDGIIEYSNQKGESSKSLNSVLPEGLFEKGLTKRKIIFSRVEKKYIAIEPMFNKESCQMCHGSQPIVAYLNVESDATQSEINFQTGIFHIIMFGLLIVVILILGSNHIFQIFINKPLNRFLDAIKEVDRGNFNVRVTHSHDDEFGILSNNFNSMIDAIVDSQNKIEELNFQKLQRADRLVTLGELTAGIAHEINNYAAIIMTRADYLKLSAQNDRNLSKYYEDLDVMVTQLEHLSKITRETLKYSRKPSNDFSELNLVEVVNNSLTMLSPILKKKNISVEKNYDSAECYNITGNFIQLEQLFNNLVNNSIDATEQEGEISIGIHDLNEKMKVTITDNGKGIDKKLINQIFLPFFTTKSNERGTGLGLYIVKNICNTHKVEINVESEIDVGTTFTLLFNKNGKNT